MCEKINLGSVGINVLGFWSAFWSAFWELFFGFRKPTTMENLWRHVALQPQLQHRNVIWHYCLDPWYLQNDLYISWIHNQLQKLQRLKKSKSRVITRLLAFLSSCNFSRTSPFDANGTSNWSSFKSLQIIDTDFFDSSCASEDIHHQAVGFHKSRFGFLKPIRLSRPKCMTGIIPAAPKRDTNEHLSHHWETKIYLYNWFLYWYTRTICNIWVSVMAPPSFRRALGR